jgi:hypothetical protein
MIYFKNESIGINKINPEVVNECVAKNIILKS